MIEGRVTRVRRVGLGMVHETSSLSMQFDLAILPGGKTLPLSTRLTAVDNARETVTPEGTIQLGRSTGTLAHRAYDWIDTLLLLGVHAELAEWAVRSVVTQLPEPEIYLPPGVELTLSLRKPLHGAPAVDSPDSPRELTQDELRELADLAATLPDRTSAPGSYRPSDLINVLLIGSRAEISAAFTAAGWTEARTPGFKAGVHNAFAVAQARGVSDAPMSRLMLGDSVAGMSWQKGFNDLSKRHHVRLWKQSLTADGREVWIGAATRDVDFAYLRPGMVFTHKVEEQIDHERDKIAYDLAFTSCAEAEDWWSRPQLPHMVRNATGDRMETDDRMAVIRLNDCSAPRGMLPADGAPLPVHGGKVQRAMRREILTARSQFIRNNPYWKGYEAVRCLVFAVENTRRTVPADPDAPRKRTLSSRLQPSALTTIVSPR
jgi:hypothetical protein